MTSLHIPRHVAIIMDGNRRWAGEKNLPVYKGHQFGEKRIEPVVDKAIELGIGYLTFWAFSTENWKRSRKEVGFILKLFRKNLDKKVDSFRRKNVRLNIIGDLSLFPKDIQNKAKAWMEMTEANKKITVNMALSYGGRDEIIRAIKKMNQESRIKNHGLGFSNNEFEITKSSFEKYLDTSGQPDPDLLIRTGGEKRLSGFMLWQLGYTELYFTDVLWPDFTAEEFMKAIEKYSGRMRRFGK